MPLCISVDCNSISENDIGFRACFLYGVDEGPCTNDDQCKDNLSCGYKNCPALYDDNDNCCTKFELLKSQNFPENYPIDIQETWSITAPTGSIINLQFHHFQVRCILQSKNTYYRIFLFK